MIRIHQSFRQDYHVGHTNTKTYYSHNGNVEVGGIINQSIIINKLCMIHTLTLQLLAASFPPQLKLFKLRYFF